MNKILKGKLNINMIQIVGSYLLPLSEIVKYYNFINLTILQLKISSIWNSLNFYDRVYENSVKLKIIKVSNHWTIKMAN